MGTSSKINQALCVLYSNPEACSQGYPLVCLSLHGHLYLMCSGKYTQVSRADAGCR